MSVTNELQQSMLDAMQLLSTKAANSTDATLTVKCTITDIVDAGLGLYEVEYGDNKFNAYTNSNISYKVNDNVYVLVPGGDFSQQKMILGATAPAATTLITEEQSDIYVPISGNLFGQDGEIELRSWEDEQYLVNINTQNFGTVFKDYLDTYKTFLFTANIRTEIDKDHQVKGNYGLILYLPFLSNNAAGGGQAKVPVWRSYNMDVTTIQGNPYDFNVYQKVNLYYAADETLEYDTSREPYIIAFTEGFGYAAPRTDINYDIHIKNIGIEVIDTLTAQEKDGYSLTIVSDDGNYFLEGKYVKSKVLTPYLKVKGKDTKLNKWDCYWFVEDASVDISNQDYLAIGGLGWKCLNRKTNFTYDAEGNRSFQYVTTDYTYTVSPADVTSTLRYKCVLVQNDVVVGDLIKLINLNAKIETTLVSATGSNSFLADIGSVDLIARIYYEGVTDNTSSTVSLKTEWQRFDKADNYIDNDFYEIIRYNDPVEIKGKTYFETEIKYPCSMLDQLNTINCTFYSITKDNNNEIVENNLGTESIVVIAKSGLLYGLAIQGGDVLYKYDADGDSPMVANYDGPASSRVKTIDPISFKVFKADGSELSELEYLYCRYTWSFPKNSMMTLKGFDTSTLRQDDDYYYIEGFGQQEINYTIANTYNKKKSNNTIILNADFDSVSMSDVISPKFLKDGESGTNGSKYSAVLTNGVNEYAYGERDANGKIRKLQLVYLADTQEWKIYDADTNSLIDFNDPELKVQVYRDGERINTDYSVEWGMFDTLSTNPCFGITGGVLNIKDNWTDPDTIYCNTVEAKITVSNNSVTNSNEVIYAYYPIEITRLLRSDMAGGTIPNLDGGFEEVLYASDGTNPQYDNTNDFVCIDNLYNDDIGNYYDYEWINSRNLKRSGSSTGSSADIKPVTKFDNGDSKNYVKVTLTMSAQSRQDIQDIIDALTVRIDDTQDLIDFYNHNKSYLFDFLSAFNYDNMISKLNDAKVLLSYRGEMLVDIQNMLEALEVINTYCIDTNIGIADFNYVQYYRSCRTSLNNAYNNLYKLGYGAGFNSLSDLHTAQITLNESVIGAKYGAGVLASLKSYVQAYNLILTNKYQVTFTKIVQQAAGVYLLQDEFDALKELEQTIVGLPHNTNLVRLAQAHDNNPAAQEFVNLKDQLEVLASYITDPSNSLINYSAFVENLLKPISELLKIYNNTDYQDRFYARLLDNLDEEKQNYITERASYTAALLPQNSDYIVHIKPIVMLFNRYELSNINGWDGNKLYVDTTNNEYLLAPQVGAGQKKNGLFTGIIMGVKQFNSGGTGQKIGLFGYSDGIQSYFLNAEDGSAIMGKSGAGQMVIDPTLNKALLYSSNFWKQYKNDGKPISYGSSNYAGQGMLIDLTTPEIRFGSGNFVVNSSGHITAKGGGSIAGWKISDNILTGGSTTLNSNGTITCVDLIANNSGSIGGWQINGTTLSGGGTTLNSNGTIECRNLIANNSGSIGGWTIGGSTLFGGGTTLNSNGTITCSRLIADSDGSIGGWSISSGALTGNGITLGTGQISCGGLTLGGGALLGPGFNLSGSGLNLSSGVISLGGNVLSGAGAAFAESAMSIGGKGVANYVGDIVANKITAAYINVDHLQAGTIQGKSVGWSTFTALAGFNSSTVYRVRLANGGEADIRAYDSPQLNQILALANVSSS